MEDKIYHFISVNYELHSIVDEIEEFIEKTEEEHPLNFYSGCEMTIPAFEDKIIDQVAGSTIEFSLPKEQAYGLFIPEKVIDIDKSVFTIDGAFDNENIFIGATIPLQNNEGRRFLGKVIDINENKVKVDLNHPLAGKTLKFNVKVLENRKVPKEEVDNFFENMKKQNGGCSCGGNCGCGCKGNNGNCGCH